MARLKTPTSILEFKGAFKKNPQRKRAGEPMPDTVIGAPPKRLKGNDRKAWLEIVQQYRPADIHALVLLCEMRADLDALQDTIRQEGITTQAGSGHGQG